MRGKRIGLVLQGGGSDAAFTGGLPRALLNKRRGFLAPDELHSVSGTSGGALNAMLLGLALHHGAGTPTRHVHRLWQLNRLESHLRGRFQALQRVPDAVIAAFVGMSREVLASNPRLAATWIDNSHRKEAAMELIDEMVRDAADALPADPDAVLLPDRPPYVTVAATEAKTATAHYFTNNQAMIGKFREFEIASHHGAIRPLSLRSVYASMANPMAFNAVNIGDGVYWDGYYTARSRDRQPWLSRGRGSEERPEPVRSGSGLPRDPIAQVWLANR